MTEALSTYPRPCGIEHEVTAEVHSVPLSSPSCLQNTFISPIRVDSITIREKFSPHADEIERIQDENIYPHKSPDVQQDTSNSNASECSESKDERLTENIFDETPAENSVLPKSTFSSEKSLASIKRVLIDAKSNRKPMRKLNFDQSENKTTGIKVKSMPNVTDTSRPGLLTKPTSTGRNAFDIMTQASRKISQEKSSDLENENEDLPDSNSEVVSPEISSKRLQNSTPTLAFKQKEASNVATLSKTGSTKKISLAKPTSTVKVSDTANQIGDDCDDSGIKSRLRKRTNPVVKYSPEDESPANKKIKTSEKNSKRKNGSKNGIADKDKLKILTISSDDSDEGDEHWSLGKTSSSKTANSRPGGKVPSMFLPTDVRKAALAKKEQEKLAVKKEEDRLAALAEAERKAKPKLVLPQSIAPVTEKEINKMIASVIELDNFQFPLISSVNASKTIENRMSETLITLATCDRILEPAISKQLCFQSFKQSDDRRNNKVKKAVICTITEEDVKLEVLQMKEGLSEYQPVKTYKRISESASSSNSRLYTEMFSASTGRDMIGLKVLCQEFSDWLGEYRTANQTRAAGHDSDDEDSQDAFSSSAIALVVGPTGIGKTSFVHAIAKDLEFNVIEINTSQCRSSKRLLSQLKEGSSIHKMSRDHSTSTADQSVILVDDGDVVLSEDSGYIQAVTTLSSMSRKPVVITTTNPDFLSQLKISCKVFEFPSDRSTELLMFLRMISMSKGVLHSNSSLEKLMKTCDFRKALIQLQMLNQFSVFPHYANSIPWFEYTRHPDKLCKLLAIDDTESLGAHGSETVEKKSTESSSPVDSDEEMDTDEIGRAVMKEVSMDDLLDLRDHCCKIDRFICSTTNNIARVPQSNLRCNIFCGDTDNELRDLFSLPLSLNDDWKVPSLDTKSCWGKFHGELSSSYIHGYSSRVSTYCDVYPFIGSICQENSKNRNLLQLLDSRRYKRHCHYLDDRNFGFSGDLKTWVEMFYTC